MDGRQHWNENQPPRGREIPTDAVPAFWDILPDLSRYPPTHRLFSQHAKNVSTQAPTSPSQKLHHDPNRPRRPKETTSPYTRLQHASGSLHDLRRYREAVSSEKKPQSVANRSGFPGVTYGASSTSPGMANPRANSDLKDLYATQQPVEKPLSRSSSRSKILSKSLRRPSDSSSSPMSPNSNDRAHLPSQQAQTTPSPSHDEARKLSRSGAVRRKSKTFQRINDDEVVDAEMGYSPSMTFNIPTPPAGMIHRPQNANESISAPTIAGIVAGTSHYLLSIEEESVDEVGGTVLEKTFAITEADAALAGEVGTAVIDGVDSAMAAEANTAGVAEAGADVGAEQTPPRGIRHRKDRSCMCKLLHSLSKKASGLKKQRNGNTSG